MTLLLLVLGAVGPVHDVLDGSEVGAEARRWLPSGRHAGSVADLWFLELISMQQDGTALTLFDPLRLSAHGRSWTQQHYFIDGFELTDPARSGRPLIDVPHAAWAKLAHRSLWTDVPAIEWTLPASAPRLGMRGSGGAPVGGPSLMGDGVFDRDPATRKGATSQRREMRSAVEVEARGGCQVEDNTGAVTAEWLQHEHRYPTLLSDDGRALDDEATRGTAVLSGASPSGWRWLLLAQQLRRSHAGGEFRLPQSLTQRQEARAAFGGVAARLVPSTHLRIDASVSGGLRSEDWQAIDDGPMTVDVQDQWLWLHRPSHPEELQRSRVDLGTVAHLGSDDATQLALRLSRTDLDRRLDVRGGRSGETYLAAASPEERALAVTLYGPQGSLHSTGQGGRLELAHAHRLAEVSLRGVAALVHARIKGGGRGLAWTAPAVGIAARLEVAGGEVMALLRDEPQSMTSELSDFLHPDRLNGGRYRWNDDGDLVPESGEQGELLARTGGRFHATAPELRAPAETRFAIGYHSPRFGPFRGMVSGIGRLGRDRLTVRYTDPAASSYVARGFDDPGGDGLGETPRADGQPGQLLTVYDRTPGSEGQETYELVNASRSEVYAGAEVQLYTPETRGWFFNLGLSGYWSYGANAYGVFADRNDPGVIDEASADPNLRVNQWGRSDNDRSFAIHLMTGVEPLEGLRGALLLRYRDGEPITRFVVVEDLQQGPTAVMAVPRGDPWPRNTFHMTLDVRLSYTLALSPFATTVTLDVFNALGSGTEISEDLRTGPTFRRSLEMVPGRSVLLGLGVDWQ